jgi:hypothetical protein
MENQIRQTIREAEKIGAILADKGIPVIIIGAIALAAHRYVRATRDVDLGVNTTIKELSRIHQLLTSSNYHAELRLPDLDDPLGGVIDVSGDFGMVQIVNYGERFPAVIEDSRHQQGLQGDTVTSLSIAPLPQLVAMKLYAGGWKSMSDIVELLRRNPETDLKEIGDTCRKYRLHGWNRVLEELQKA